MASDDSGEFDFLDAIIKIPKGESLSPSRRTDCWDSSLIHGADNLSHAEIQLTNKYDDEAADDSGLSDGQKVALGTRRPDGPRTRLGARGVRRGR